MRLETNSPSPSWEEMIDEKLEGRHNRGEHRMVRRMSSVALPMGMKHSRDRETRSSGKETMAESSVECVHDEKNESQSSS